MGNQGLNYMETKASEIFEGKDSSLYKTFVEVTSVDECKNHQIYCKGRDENDIADWTCRLCNKAFFSKESKD